ncbi:MAG: protein kinase domain-containing protein, partial [Polyangiaceae bacterium]
MNCPTCQAPVAEGERFCSACGAVVQASDTQAGDPMVGQTLGGKYKVVRLLGEGGMGAVYEGEQKLGTTNRKVAVKTLHPHLSRDAKIKARFEREVGTIAELEHPNTIQVFDFGTTEDGILYIVMEFLQGKSLAEYLEKDGAMMPDRVAYIMSQVCGSLEEAHARNIVHRDLKPDNVVLVERAGKKDFVKVLDFGIAKRSKEEDKNEQKLTQQGMVLGTPPYMSPEQFTGRPIDLRSDIYSLGVMGYEMLTAKLPFTAETAWEWATKHMTEQPIPIETYFEGQRAPEGMRNAVRRAMEKSPDARFQTVQEFCDAFTGQGVFVGGPQRASVLSNPERQKTEVGDPTNPSGVYGGPPMGAPLPTPAPGMAQLPAGNPFGGPPVGAYTPAGGNVAYPTPANIPGAPPRAARGGGGRTVLLVVAGLIGVASVIAIAFAVRSSSSGAPVTFSNNTGTPPPATNIAPTTPPTQPSRPPEVATVVPPLVPGHPTQTVPAHPTAPVQPPPARYNGPECVRAREFKALGHAKDAEKWALACIAKG